MGHRISDSEDTESNQRLSASNTDDDCAFASEVKMRTSDYMVFFLAFILLSKSNDIYSSLCHTNKVFSLSIILILVLFTNITTLF
jgi:hypothetical protein